LRGPIELAVGERPIAFSQELLEPVEVELAWTYLQNVARRLRDEPRWMASIRAERFAQARDLHSQLVICCTGGRVRQQLIDQTIPRDDAVGTQQQHRQQCPLSRPADLHRIALESNLEWPKYPKFKPHPLAPRPLCYQIGAETRLRQG
jgi:hypothetical protein